VSGDYLWDGSGPEDPEVERLLAVLRPLRRVPPPPALPLRTAPRFGWRTLAAAAAVAVALSSLPRRQAGGWELDWTVRGGDAAAGASATTLLRAGEWLDTGERQARLSVGRIGVVRLEPATRVGLVDPGERAHRLALARGTLHAAIWAPPGQFLVDTPAALAVDLGCAYTLEVAPDGSGLLHVEAGWVGFEHGRLCSLVPAGASCRVRPRLGPGTPRFDTAATGLAAALDTLDALDGRDPAAAQAREHALSSVLSDARPRDALSLWHLLARLEGAERERAFDRLATLVPPPPGVTRDGIARGDEAMRDLWWDELGFGSSGFWRLWTHRTRAPGDTSR
jgi:hypothetical protein